MRTDIGWMVLSLCILSACASDDAAHETTSASEVGELGTLQLTLSGQDAMQRSYRLRAATFRVEGSAFDDPQPILTSLSSDAEPDAVTLRTRLLSGYYSVTLSSEDWFLERVTPDGFERVAQAVLLSPRTQYAYVQSGQPAQLAFQFGVDGSLIDFVGGQLELGIQVVNAPPGSGL
jgi:hypothetical protein